MATTMMPGRRTLRSGAWRLYGCVGLTLGMAAGLLWAPTPEARWASLALLPLSSWLGIDWVRVTAQARSRQAVSARLSRLPDDFFLLPDLTVPAPWGVTRIDQLIISRYGLVVIGTGADPGLMTERIEAIRSLLFIHNLAAPSVPVVPLILLPPGAPPPRRVQHGVPVLRVEHLRLKHLAPAGQPVLTDNQVAAIGQCLLHVRAVS